MPGIVAQVKPWDAIPDGAPLKALVKHCCKLDPTDRPSFLALCEQLEQAQALRWTASTEPLHEVRSAPSSSGLVPSLRESPVSRAHSSSALISRRTSAENRGSSTSDTGAVASAAVDDQV